MVSIRDEATPEDVAVLLDGLRELGKRAVQLAETYEAASLLLTANIVMAVRVALERGNEEALRELERVAHHVLHPALHRPYAVNATTRSVAREFLVQTIADAIAYWLPVGEAGRPARIHPWSWAYYGRLVVPDAERVRFVPVADAPPQGFADYSSAKKMAVYIDAFALKKRRWTGVLSQLPPDVALRSERAITTEIEFGRLTGPEYAQKLCMVLLKSWGMSKADRDQFMASRRKRKQRSKPGA